MFNSKANVEPIAVLRQQMVLVPPTRYLEYRGWLEHLYLCAKQNIEHYSYIQFSGHLGFGENNVLHLIIRGKRNLSPKALDKIVEILQIKGTERLYLESLVRYCNSRKSEEREELFQRMLQLKSKVLTSPMEQNQLEYYSEWFHPVIREMTAMADFRSDPYWIADHVVPRILPEQARKSLELLDGLKLISYNEELKRHQQTQSIVSTGEEVASHAVVRYHQRVLELARDAITRVDPEKRDISAVTVAVSEETAQMMKAEIQAFRKRLLALAEKDESPDRIYQVNFQLFPFTK